MFRPARPALFAAALFTAASTVALTGCGGSPAPTAGPSTSPVADTAVSATPSPTTTTTKPAGPATNGLEDLSPNAASEQMRKAFTTQRFVHVTGSIVSGGQTTGLTADVVAGSGAKATFRLGPQTVEILQLGQAVYLSGNKAFLTEAAGASGAKALKGKYMRTTTKDSTYASLKDLLTVDGLSGLLPTDPLRAGTHELAGGRQVLAFADETGGRFVVSNEGAAVPLSITGKDGAESVNLQFSYAPVTLTAPPKNKVVKIPAS